MCLDPITLTAMTAGMTALGAVAKYSADADAADQQEKVNAAQRTAIGQQRDAERMDAERAQQEAYEAAASSSNEHAQQAYKDMASFNAIAGESGGGVTSQRAAAAIGIQNGQDMATIAANARRQQSEIGFGEFASQNRAATSMASIKSVKQPSLLEAGLTIAGAGMSYQTGMNKIKTAKG